ncbi:23S rRNA (adenine(2503)-C(2))-methyltransferase RlmN [candidate division TA06 bacterium]|uniref:Probable dual-specificity RNA methyltransferase RlmN n=1 Tax=candidate division TA06 bacterium TaxID=2250710 RepID=A0A933ICJ2_UNCT6|nr:23S rRNA (adenine(2503)-C(2))-methyltransferase RlmN [candidate division TA06 bacterium]
MKTKTSLVGRSFQETLELLAPLGFKGFQVKQLMAWICRNNVPNFSAMTDLSQTLRDKLEKDFCLHELSRVKKVSSRDGATKLLLQARDGQQIESVVISAPGRLTACLSSQAGCKLACSFCATGKMGLVRNLTASEIVDQLCLLQELSPEQRITNVVFMGMGEPMENYDQTLKAARIINSHQGFNLGARHITISTAGLVPGILRLMEEPEQFKLAISLNAADDAVRSRLMPVNKKYPLKALLEAVKRYSHKKGKLVFFEYILLAGINDSLEDAEKLSRLLKGIPGKVNLIPYNPGGRENDLQPSSVEARRAFYDKLCQLGVAVTFRASKGQDIRAACGQLKAASVS